MGKPSAPPPPDYAAAAAAQGEANLKTAQYNAAIGRPDEQSVGGTKTWTLKPGADPKNPQPGDYIVNTSLSPEQQSLYDKGTGISNSFLDTAGTGLDRVGQAMASPFSLNGLPGVSMATPGQQIQPGQLPNTPNLNPGIDTSGLARMPTDAAGTRDAVTQAIIDRATPGLDRAADASRARSIAAGGDVGSASYNTTEDANARARNDLTLGAISQGSDAAQKEIASQLAMRGQGFGEATAKAGFGNDTLSQMFSQGLAREGQQFGQQGQASSQNFQQALTGAGFNNDARMKMIQDILLQRQQPLNEVNALRTGSQVQMPTFGGAQQGNAQAAPIFDAATAQGANAQAQYAQQMQGYNGLLNSGAMAAALYFSDSRLKTNVKRVGSLADGTGVYTWDWTAAGYRVGAGNQPGFGVMAQEHPEAASPDPRTGFLKVDYSEIAHV